MQIESLTFFFGGKAPRYSSAVTGSTTTIVVTFSEAVNISTAGWSAKKNGSNLAISSVSGSGTNTCTFTVGSMANGDVITMSYDSTTGSTVSTATGIELKSFINKAVTNTIPVVTYIVRSITIDHTKVPSTQTDFPVLFTGTYSYLKTVANGGDVESPLGYDVNFFSDAACTTMLAWETVIYEATTGTVEYHIKVPSVSSSTDTIIYLGYGNSSVTTDQSDPTAVWDTNFKGVWHLPDGTTLTANDSTVNGNNGTLGAFGPDPTTGQIDGGALGISGNSPNINLGTDSSLEISQNVTMSCWVNMSNVGILQNIITKGGEDYRIRMNGLSIDVGSFDGSDHQTSYASSISIGVWYYLSGGYNGTAWELRLNGSNVSSTSDATGAIPTVGTTARLMSNDGGTQRFMQGSLDEVRISDVYRSDNWELATYNNQNSPSTFYTISSPI